MADSTTSSSLGVGELGVRLEPDEGMGKLMDQGRQPAVGRRPIVNRDSACLAVTGAVRGAGVAEVDRVVDLASELDELGDQSPVAVARDFCAGRGARVTGWAG